MIQQIQIATYSATASVVSYYETDNDGHRVLYLPPIEE